MAFREVRVNEVREVLRSWLAGDGLRLAGERAGVDRKTARRYVEAAVGAGLVRDGGAGQLSDGLIGVVAGAVRPVRAGGHGRSWEVLLGQEEAIGKWVDAGLALTNIEGKLARLGVVVPYRTLHRFASQRCGFGGRAPTVRVADGEPGQECQIDFARMGLVPDLAADRRRVAHALIFTAVHSRHMFVWLSFTQTLSAVIAGSEAAWVWFGGVFPVLIPDNMSPVIARADPLNPTFTTGWLDYAQSRGFGTDPARVRSPKDKPRVERVVQYVRGNFFAGEQFADLADAQRRAEVWCATTAGLRVHGTTAQRPAELFAEAEQAKLLPVPSAGYDVPVFATPKVARDLHIEVARSLYSVPAELIGQRVEVRADSALVKVFSRGQLVKTHPRVGPGERSTDAKDYPVGRADYALRDVAALSAKAMAAGPAVGVYAARLLDSPLPWTKMRAVYRLLGLVRSYGPDPVDAACSRALELDVVDVTKITRMLENATETGKPPPVLAKVAGAPARFARDAAEFEVTR